MSAQILLINFYFYTYILLHEVDYFIVQSPLPSNVRTIDEIIFK